MTVKRMDNVGIVVCRIKVSANLIFYHLKRELEFLSFNPNSEPKYSKVSL